MSVAVTEQNQGPLEVVVAEDQRELHEPIGHFLTTEAFPDRDLNIHFTVDAHEAYDHIATLSGSAALLLADLHMDPDGSDPSKNGEALISSLAEDGVDIPFVINSGTISLVRSRRLAEASGEFALLKKDSFSPMASRLDRTILADRLNEALLSTSTARISDSTLQLIKEIEEEGIDVSKADLLVDYIKASTTRLLDRYEDFLSSCDGSEFLDVHGLYNEDPSRVSSGIHTFKNSLKFFTDKLRAEYTDLPEGLIEELTTLLVSVKLGYESLPEEVQSVDLIDLVEVVVKAQSEIAGIHIGFESEITEWSFKGDPVALSSIVSGLIQNGIIHGDGSVIVTLREDGVIEVMNNTPLESEPLPFTIEEGELVGEIPNDSTALFGSGTGLSGILGEVEGVEGATFSLTQQGYLVIAELSLGGELNDKSEEVQPKVNLKPFGKVIYLCHDGEPKRTFKHFEGSYPEGYEPYYLEVDRPLFRGLVFDLNKNGRKFRKVLDQNADIFNEACLVVMHSTVRGAEAVSTLIAEKYPHIAFLPVTHEVPCFNYDWDTNEYNGLNQFSESTLSPQLVAEWIRVEDPTELGELSDSFHSTHKCDDDLETILNISHRIAEDRAKMVAEGVFDIPTPEEFVAQEEKRLREIVRGDLAEVRNELQEVRRLRDRVKEKRTRHRPRDLRRLERGADERARYSREIQERKVDRGRLFYKYREIFIDSIEGAPVPRISHDQRYRLFVESLSDSEKLEIGKVKREMIRFFRYDLHWTLSSIENSAYRAERAAHQYGDDVDPVKIFNERYGDIHTDRRLVQALEADIWDQFHKEVQGESSWI